LFSPVDDFITQLFAVIAFRIRIPAALVKPVLSPFAVKIFMQDAEILEEQTGQIRAFGGEQYMSTDADVLGREIWRLMKQAERGDAEAAAEGPVRRLKLLI
jgi:hypothetical protein